MSAQSRRPATRSVSGRPPADLGRPGRPVGSGWMLARAPGAGEPTASILDRHPPPKAPPLHHQPATRRVDPDCELLVRHLQRVHPHRDPCDVVLSLGFRAPLPGFPVDEELDPTLGGQGPERIGSAVEWDARPPDRLRLHYAALPPNETRR